MKALFFAVCLMITPALTCSGATQQTSKKDEKPVSKNDASKNKPSAEDKNEASEKDRKRKLPLETLLLLEQARTAPPEIAADALIRLAESSKIPEADQKRELLEEAFRYAAQAQQPLRRRYIGGNIDTRTGYLSYAFDLKLDTMSLQCRAVRAMIAIDPQKARSLFGEVSKPQLPPLTCADTMRYEVSEYYETLGNLAQSSFSPAEKQNDEQVWFLRNYIGDINSPVQLSGAAKAIQSLKLPPAKQDILVNALSDGLKRISADDRSFSIALYDTMPAIASLEAVLNKESNAREKLVEALRAYLVKHFSGSRCADNLASEKRSGGLPRAIKTFNEQMLSKNQASGSALPISAEDIKPSRVEGSAVFEEYWQTPEARRLLTAARHLRFGSQKTPLTDEERATTEWHDEAVKFLNDVRTWDSSSEKTEADYFHQKRVMFEALIELLPPGPLRNEVMMNFVSFITSSKLQTESRIEWLQQMKSMMIRLKKPEERAMLLEAYSNSGNQVLTLYANLEKAGIDINRN